MNKCSLRALGGSCSTSSAIFQKNRVLISHEIKYSVVSSIESLPPLNCNSHSMRKCTNFLKKCKTFPRFGLTALPGNHQVL